MIGHDELRDGIYYMEVDWKKDNLRSKGLVSKDESDQIFAQVIHHFFCWKCYFLIFLKTTMKHVMKIIIQSGSFQKFIPLINSSITLRKWVRTYKQRLVSNFVFMPNLNFISQVPLIMFQLQFKKPWSHQWRRIWKKIRRHRQKEKKRDLGITDSFSHINLNERYKNQWQLTNINISTEKDKVTM